MTTTYTPAQTALTEELRRIAGIENVARALGIQDTTSQDEEFWKGQRRAATSRFYMMLLEYAGIDLAVRREELDDLTANQLRHNAADLIDVSNMDYTQIRQWFLNGGQYAYNVALARRKEREHVQSMRLRLLVVLEKGASYLAYNENRQPILVASPDQAHQFKVEHASELELSYLQDMSKHFAAIQTLFDAKSVKLLAGPRSA
jgi:hypothetical protein